MFSPWWETARTRHHWRKYAVELGPSLDAIHVGGRLGALKTSFWMPLLFRPNGIQLVVTPLNLLGTQNECDLGVLGMRAVAVRAETATPRVFRVSDVYGRVVITNPEELMKEGGGFEQLWKKDEFTSRLISVIFDEAHCVSLWQSFRPSYKHLGRLRHLLPHTPFYLASATLPDEIRHEVMSTLQIQASQCLVTQLSNERPNVYLRLRNALLVTQYLSSSCSSTTSKNVFVRPTTFEHDCTQTRGRSSTGSTRKCPKNFVRKILQGSRVQNVHQGVDIRNISVVVQWRLTCDLNTLWQRFGRATRDPDLEAVAILFVEAKYFDEEREKKTRSQKRKAEQQLERQKKKARTKSASQPSSSRESGHPQAVDVPLQGSQDSGSGGEVGARPLDCSVPQGSSQEQPAELTLEEASGVGHVGGKLAAIATLRGEFAAAYTLKKTEKRRKKKAGEEEVLSPELDTLVNAATRPVKCYRAPVMAYYGNDRIQSDGHLCRPSGCSRCVARLSPVCCILCSPDAPCFQRLAPRELEVDSNPANRASRLKKNMQLSDAGRDLRTALDNFRRQRMVDKHGESLLDTLGASMMMPNSVLERLVECAEAKKIASASNLEREVGKKWSKAHELGPAVVDIVLSHFPRDTPFSTTPLTPRQAPLGNSAAMPPPMSATPSTPQPTVRRYKCSACHTVGHNKNNPICPRHPSKAGRENVPTVQVDAQQSPRAAGADPTVPLTSPGHMLASPQSPARTRTNVSPANSPKSPTRARLDPTSTDVLESLFATPAYRRNAQVKTLDMIIAERSRTSAVGSHSLDTDQLTQGMSSLMAPVPASRFYGRGTDESRDC